MTGRSADAKSTKSKALRRCLSFIASLLVALWPLSALAIQEHSEGIQVHQVAHLFFLFSMLMLIYWLRKWRLVVQKGWRCIQYASCFLIAWNIDAFAGHWLDEQGRLLVIRMIDPLTMEILTPPGADWLAVVYYVLKLDHLLCVPALLFLFMGLRRLCHDLQESEQGESSP